LSAGEYPGQLSDDSPAAPFVEAIEVFLPEQHRRQRCSAIDAEQVPWGSPRSKEEGTGDEMGAHGNRSLAVA